jgi:hypothetical protein
MPRSKPPQPRGAPSARTLAPAQRREKSSIRAILRFLGRGLRAFAARAIALWIWGVDAAIWCLLWIWKNPWRSTKTAVSIFFRLATLISVGYLVFDRIYETGATIFSPTSDPKSPFLFPFTITNNSHLFHIHNVVWDCVAIHIETEHGTTLDRGQFLYGSQTQIGPGQSLNISCNPIGPTSHIININDPIVEASIAIGLKYDSDIFGVYLWRRSPAPTRFTWMSKATTPQWIKGNFAQ